MLLEEISHSLGIDIIGPNNVARNSELDSHKYTVTSRTVHPDMVYEDDYITPAQLITEGEDIFGPHATGLQLFDIAALQKIYGRDYTTRGGATAYSKAGAFSSAMSDDSFIYTIWDGGGTDAIFAADYTNAVQIDLRQGRFSSVGNRGDGAAVAFDSGDYDAGNVAIAYHTVIENATGTNDTNKGDILIGNAWNNVLRGLDGDDFLYGDGFAYDGVEGFSGIDAQDMNDPNRTRPLSDDDTLIGGAGNDFLHGGSGSDTVDYSGGSNGVTVNLNDNGDGSATDGFGDPDTLFSIENLILTGEDDTVNLGAPGGRVIDAGDGDNDTVIYNTPVVADYNAGPNGGIAIYDQNGLHFDTLIGVENVEFTAGVVLPDFDDSMSLRESTVSTPTINDYWV